MDSTCKCRRYNTEIQESSVYLEQKGKPCIQIYNHLILLFIKTAKRSMEFTKKKFLSVVVQFTQKKRSKRKKNEWPLYIKLRNNTLAENITAIFDVCFFLTRDKCDHKPISYPTETPISQPLCGTLTSFHTHGNLLYEGSY